MGWLLSTSVTHGCKALGRMDSSSRASSRVAEVEPRIVPKQRRIDPARNVAIIDALTVGLCALAATPLISFYMLDIQKIYPGHLVWGRSLITTWARGSPLFTCGHGRRIGNPRGISEESCRGREGTVQPATFRFGWTQHKGYAVLLCLVATSHVNGHSAP